MADHVNLVVKLIRGKLQEGKKQSKERQLLEMTHINEAKFVEQEVLP